MATTRDPGTAVVVGGGVIGLAAAWYLRRRGADVTVVERDEIGAGASWGNAGWVTPSLSAPLPAPGLVRYGLRSLGRPASPLYIAPRLDPALARWLWSFRRHCNARDHDAGREATVRLGARTLALYDELAADGVRFSMWSAGLLFCFLAAAGAERELEHLRPLAAHGYAIPDAPLDGDAMRRLEPALSDRVGGGFLLAQERHVDPGTLTAGLAERLRAEGVTILERAEANGFELEGRRVTAVRTPAQRLPADHVVLAAGAWTGPLAEQLGSRIRLQAGKGYSFHVRPPRAPRHALYLGEAKAAATPLGGGRVRIAGTMELSGVNLRLDPRRVDALAAGARRFLADWPARRLDEPWVGMRPLTPDGLPVVGPLERCDNVFVSTGHSMLGVTLAPATGEQLAELILTGRAPAALLPFFPRRPRA